MKQLLLLTLLAMTARSHAQVKLEDIVKPGTKLIYTINDNGNTYDFTVLVKDKNGASFDWQMGAPENKKGTINHTEKALKSAFKMYNFFQSETRTLDDRTLSLWLSQKTFSDLTKGTDAIKICMNQPTDEPAVMKYFMDGELVIKIDGNGAKIYGRMVKPAKKLKDGKWIIDPSSDDVFTYYNSASLPIVLRMHTTSYMTLKEIRTH